jgi:5-carboxymethyl-2-hydroxymuconate isomerase
VFFFKPPSAIIHDGGQIILPAISNDVHHEVEMTILIGEHGNNIHRSAALKHVAGYGIGLDMTMRDIQNEAKKKGLPWALAKGFDTSAPVSEFFPAETIGDPGSLNIQLFINGKLRQSSSTSKFVFPVDKVIAYISQYITFEPGDIIFTGTPEGVSRVEHGDKLEASLLDAQKNIIVSLSVSVQ